MQTIIVGFSKPKKFKIFAWLIQKAYSIPYDHTYIRIHATKYDRDLIYQASKTMVNFMGVEHFLSENDVIREFSVNLSDENYIKMMQFAIDTAGTPYGFKSILGLAIQRIAFWCGKNIKNPFSDGKITEVCSELISTILIEFGEKELPKDVDDMTPLDVYNFMLTLNP